MKIRRYSELVKIDSFIDRFRYLVLHGSLGTATFGFDRHINQSFYRSSEWRRIRQHVIARDLGCDLGVADHEIYDKILIHHMNPMRVEDIVEGNESIIDPEFLICTSHKTHNAIHFGDENQLPKVQVVRRPGDTKLW
ncbi:HNH endonuclease [Gordonia phage Secretariat]|uniref:HNH endonuclease n=1 Tax=Gordonia phage Secretariat TaxID=2725616 RepID=A0A6M3SUQ0_9CAUD|nr:HNH endonuclease [Gordonia phage Secretariat]QJD49586.1 HNH endonuclease [Gordonia phage Secretariat]